MRALRIAILPIAILSLVGGTMVVAAAPPSDADQSIAPVEGTLAVHQLPGGTFNVDDRVYEYREFPVAGSTHHVSERRAAGTRVGHDHHRWRGWRLEQ